MRFKEFLLEKQKYCSVCHKARAVKMGMCEKCAEKYLKKLFGNYVKEEIHEPEYMVRQTKKAPETYQVSKWGGGTGPRDVYRVEHTRDGWICNCPGNLKRGTCKHVDIVKDWIKKGKPSYGFGDEELKKFLEKHKYTEEEN